MIGLIIKVETQFMIEMTKMKLISRESVEKLFEKLYWHPETTII